MNNVKTAMAPRSRIQHPLRQFWAKNSVGYLFMLPFLVLFALFVVLPVAVAIFTSFTDYNMLQPAKFVGFNNYRLLLTDDDVFITALKNTLVFALITGPIGYIMSFFSAWIINTLKFKSAFALAFYAPSITNGVAMSIVWMTFFSNDRYGYINNFLLNLGVIDSPILWTLNSEYIMTVIMIISVWMSMGNGFLVFLSGLQGMNKTYFEAAAIDGINSRFKELWYITLPLMKPQLLFGAINSIVGSFGVFDIAVSVAGLPSPNYAGHTIVAHLYDYAFIRFQMGYASAVSVILFLITFLLGRVVMKLLSSHDE